MSIILRLGRNTAIYTVTSVLQRGVSFLLLPIYARFLSQEDFGIFTVISIVSAALATTFMLSLNGAVTRYWFEYRDDPERLRDFLGTTITFMLLCCGALGGLLLAAGAWLLSPVLGDVAFWPYAALGVAASIFQPLVTTYLALLQTEEHTTRFAVLSLAQFTLTMGVAVTTVVALGAGAEGPLAANLVATAALFIACIMSLRGRVRFVLDRSHLAVAFRYSLPLVPHSWMGQIQVIVDRLLLNGLIGPTAAGLYQVAYLIGGVLAIATDSANRAFVPIAMDALRRDRQGGLDELRDLGSVMVIGFCMLAAGIGAFAPELVSILATERYIAASVLVPLVAVAFAAIGIYYVLVNILFYVTSGTSYVMLGTMASGVSSISLNLYLIPTMGPQGAAFSLLCSQVIAAVVIGVIGFRFERVRWRYAAFIASLGLAIMVAYSQVLLDMTSLGWRVLAKMAVLALLYVLLNFLHWGRANFLGEHVGHYFRVRWASSG